MPIDNLDLLPNEVEEGSEFDCRELADQVLEAIKKGQHYFLQCQHPDGYWWFELESNVTITAEYLMLLNFAGIQDKERNAKMANYILEHQRPDGTWALFKGGKGDISTTVEAYFALKLTGYTADDPRLEKARRFILAHGGLAKTRVFTKIFLALFGQYDWKAVPSVPVEFMLLPLWFPFNIYNFSSWARATFVPLSIVLDAKPIKPIPVSQGVQELFSHEQDEMSHRPSQGILSWEWFFAQIERLIKAHEESRLRIFRKKGLEKALRWVLDHQEETGDWAGIQPAMVNSILALLVQGHGISSGPVQKGLEALERFTIESGNQLLLQSCISPVWDTGLTLLALSSSGLKKSHSAMIKACQWLAGKQIFKKGDWSIKRPHLEPGGWAFEFVNNWYPDIDDTAVVLMALNSCDYLRFLKPENLKRAVEWVVGMQGKDGGWAAFDVDNNAEFLNQMPFGDLKAMIDPSTPDVTGRVLELLGYINNYPLSSKTIREALRFLKKTKEKDGLWWGRWGVNYIYGTWSVLMGLSSIGEDMTKPYIRNAIIGLRQYQNADGGWGEPCESYANLNSRMRGKSTASQTAWALMALIAAGEGTSKEAMRGLQFLLNEQAPDGTWEEEEFTATGFPNHFMIKYHNYRNCFPLMALGRFLRHLREKGLFVNSLEGKGWQGHL